MIHRPMLRFLPLVLLAGLAFAQDPLIPVPVGKVRLDDRFFTPRLVANHKVTIPACLEHCETSGRIRNFALAAGQAEGQRRGLPFDDSDVYKVLEAIANTLASQPDPELEARGESIIALIAAAQQEDGYLNTYFTLEHPAERWKDIAHGHELYCAGHLIEAAVAWKQATGRDVLLQVAVRFADLIDEQFGPGRRLDPPGHPELELALVKLAEATGERRYLELARFFIEQRGKAEGRTLFGEYAQDHRPLREQTGMTGHAVRALYLYSGATDIAALTGDASLLEPLKRIWEDVVGTRMYITGGLGNSASNEGVTAPFELPNDTAYCETCAGIGMVLWNQRLFLATGEPRYGDVIERVLYNNLAAAVSLAGDRFFYANPLGSTGATSRAAWFECACCPTNLARFLPTLPSLVFSTRGNTLYVNQLVSAETTVELAGVKVRVKVQSDFPDRGNVVVLVQPSAPATFSIKLRRPGWNVQAMVQHDFKEREHELHDHEQAAGWAVFERRYEGMDGFVIHFLAPVRRERADPRIEGNRGRVALARGPLVYCLEGHDNGGAARALVLPPEAELRVENDGRLLGGTRVIHGRGRRVERAADGTLTSRPATVTAIPYAIWANREPSDMVVWIPEEEGLAEPR